jgi:hypothetical protein
MHACAQHAADPVDLLGRDDDACCCHALPVTTVSEQRLGRLLQRVGGSTLVLATYGMPVLAKFIGDSTHPVGGLDKSLALLGELLPALSGIGLVSLCAPRAGYQRREVLKGVIPIKQYRWGRANPWAIGVRAVGLTLIKRRARTRR